MDTDPVSFKEFDDYLRDLERINVLRLAYRPTPALAKARPNGFSSRAADIGSRRRQRRWRRGAAVEEMGVPEEFEIRSSLAKLRVEETNAVLELPHQLFEEPVTRDYQPDFIASRLLCAGWHKVVQSEIHGGCAVMIGPPRDQPDEYRSLGARVAPWQLHRHAEARVAGFVQNLLAKPERVFQPID